MSHVDLQQQPFTYTHEEVQHHIEDAQLNGQQKEFEEEYGKGKKTGREEGKEDNYAEGYEEGSKKWAEGYKAGYDAGKKTGKEKEDNACKDGRLEGYELGTQDGKEEEQWKWLMEGHGDGLCLSMVAYVHELFRSLFSWR